MSIENKNIYNEKEKNKELSEKELKLEHKKQLEFLKTKEKISVEIESEKELSNFKELIEKWVITNEVAKKIIEWKNISEEEIKEIFNKIDEIEEVKNIDNYLPLELRVSKDDYLKAINDDIFRVTIITKIESSLAILSNQIVPDGLTWMNVFSWFLTVLDKNLVKIQENTIDVKDSLKQIDEKKWIKKEEKTLKENFLDFIRQIFK